MAKPRRFTGDFKAKVALEALRGERPIQDIVAKYGVHPKRYARILVMPDQATL